MNLNYLRDIKSWTPLKDVACPSVHLGNGLYQIDTNLFLVAQSYDRHFIEGLPDAPFVTLLYWATSIEAIKRCFLQNTELDTFPEIEPPRELLFGTNGSYEELLKFADRSSERAIYGGIDGKFLHKVIEVDRYCFFFLGQKIENAQKPFAIEVNLS